MVITFVMPTIKGEILNVRSFNFIHLGRPYIIAIFCNIVDCMKEINKSCEYDFCFGLILWIHCVHTGKPLYKDHHRDQQYMVHMHRWCLCRWNMDTCGPYKQMALCAGCSLERVCSTQETTIKNLGKYQYACYQLSEVADG